MHMGSCPNEYSCQMGSVFQDHFFLVVLGPQKATNFKYESLDDHLKERSGSQNHIWEVKSHLFKALVLPTFIYDIWIWAGDLTTPIGRILRGGMKRHMMSHVKLHFTTTYYILLARIWKTTHKINCFEANYRFSTMAYPPTLLLVSQSSNLTFPTPCRKGFDTQHKLTTMSKKSWGLSQWEMTNPAPLEITFDDLKEICLLKTEILSISWESTRSPPPQGFSQYECELYLKHY